MTDFIDFPLGFGTPAPAGPDAPRKSQDSRALRFVVADQADALPDEPGLFVLMSGALPGETAAPLAFGSVQGSLRRQLPHSPEFAQALREGLGAIGFAPLPEGSDPARLIEVLGRRTRAPINARQRALRAIDNARILPDLPGTELPLAAE